jgi:hypothetical protein
MMRQRRSLRRTRLSFMVESTKGRVAGIKSYLVIKSALFIYKAAHLLQTKIGVKHKFLKVNSTTIRLAQLLCQFQTTQEMCFSVILFTWSLWEHIWQHDGIQNVYSSTKFFVILFCSQTFGNCTKQLWLAAVASPII